MTDSTDFDPKTLPKKFSPMSHQPERPPPLFIVGCERSGTTMLQKLFSRHPEVWVPREETFFFPRIYPEFKTLIEGGKPAEAALLVSRVPLVRKWKVEISGADIRSESAVPAYAEAIDAVMMRKAEAEGKKRWGEKTPSYVFSIDLLTEMFPDARFLFVVRDGRDVSLSLSQLAWGPNNAYAVARHWTRVFREWKAISPGLGDRAMQVRYEDFLEQPEEWVSRIGKWIGQDDLGKCLDGFRVKKGNSQKWRNKFFFSGKEHDAFRYVAGAELVELEYEKDILQIHLPVWQRLLWRADDFWRRITNRSLRRHGSDEAVQAG